MSPLDLAVCWYGLTMLACSGLLLAAVAWDARWPLPRRRPSEPAPVDPQPPWIPDETWHPVWSAHDFYQQILKPPTGVELEFMRPEWQQSTFCRFEDFHPLMNCAGLYWRQPLPYTVINVELSDVRSSLVVVDEPWTR